MIPDENECKDASFPFLFSRQLIQCHTRALRFYPTLSRVLNRRKCLSTCGSFLVLDHSATCLPPLLTLLSPPSSPAVVLSVS